MIGFPLVQNLTDFHKLNNSTCSGTKTASGQILTTNSSPLPQLNSYSAKCQQTNKKQNLQKNSTIVKLLYQENKVPVSFFAWSIHTDLQKQNHIDT